MDDFLIITYTRAAAAELRSKIAAELTKRLAENPGDRHLKRQLLRVYQADIKTVDAFCTALLRENTHLLAREGDRHALTPDFRVLDESDAILLRRRVLDRENLRKVWAETDAFEDILLTLESPCQITDRAIILDGGYELRVGSTAYLRGIGYMGAGPVVSIEEVAK